MDNLIPQRNKGLIQNNLRKITSKLYTGQLFILQMQEAGILQKHFAEETRKCKKKLDRNMKIINLILTRPLKDLVAFLEILCKLDQHHVARLIEPTIGLCEIEETEDTSVLSAGLDEGYCSSIKSLPHQVEDQAKYRSIPDDYLEVIVKHRTELVQELNLSKKLQLRLKEMNVIPDDLLNANEKEIEQKIEIIEYIEEQSEACLQKFLKALKDDDQKPVLEIFKCVQSEEEALTPVEILHVANEEAVESASTIPEASETAPFELHTLELRDYQKELAQEAMIGKNTVICAPTGSGKTIIAAFVAKHLRKQTLEVKEKFKALFLVCTRHLSTQQRDAFHQVFTGPDRQIVEAMSRDETLEGMLKKHDIIMLTAQIFANSLERYDLGGPGCCISDFDLLILDECHHTYDNHPYNTIMRLYQGKKREGNAALPQIIGLSASLGVGPDEDPQDHYVTICANLDCTQVEHVRKNKQNLLEHNPKPSRNQISPVPSRKDDKFIKEIKLTMENFQTNYLVASCDKTPLFGSQHYQNWTVEGLKEAKEERPINRVRWITFQTLRILNDALIMYSDLDYQQVRSYLKEKLNEENLPEEPLRQQVEIFNEVNEALKRVDAATGEVLENPKIVELLKLLEELSSNSESKGILLTKTRLVTKGLVDIIQNHPVVGKQIRAGRLVGKMGEELTMTDKEQYKICQRFQKDWHDPEAVNLLVATDIAQEGLDIPKCNYVIRYDFVSDEIGSVQSRGRARAKNSECYLIVSEGSKNEQREWENLGREHRMLDTLSHMDERALASLVKQKQEDLWRKYLRDLDKKKMEKQTDAFTVEVVCSECHAFLCRGSDIVKKGSHYLCDAEDFAKNRVEIYPIEAEKNYRYEKWIGGVSCKDTSCQQKIGNVLKFKNDPYQRKFGYNIRCKGILLKEGKRVYPLKKWSATPFQVREEPLGN